MSRIGRKPIPVPSGVDVKFDGAHVTVKGPKGTLERDLVPDITFTREGDELIATRPSDAREHRSLHGLTRSLVNNMVVGVSEGFTRDLEIVGVGYRAVAQSPNRLELALG
jgi:large subunit ribosomal protein L6